jgi:integrase
MAISKRTYPSGREVFRVRIFRDGRCIESAEFERLRDAKTFEAERRVLLRRSDWVDPSRGRVSFDGVAQDWMTTRSGVAARTRDTESWLYTRWIKPVFGSRRVASITSADVARWMGSLGAEGAARSTVRRALAVLRAILGHAVADRMISSSPASVVRAPRGGARREGRALTVAELERFIVSLPDEFRVPVACLALTGLRFSEWAALTVGDVAETRYGRVLRIHRAMTQSRGGGARIVGDTKGHRSRAVPVPGALAEYVSERVATAAAEEPLFPTASGLHWTNTNFRSRSHWTLAVRDAGLKGLRIHDLRHTAATLMLGGGADLKSVSRILGHASTVMTADLYGHVIDSHIFEAAAKLPDLSLTREAGA